VGKEPHTHTLSFSVSVSLSHSLSPSVSPRLLHGILANRPWIDSTIMQIVYTCYLRQNFRLPFASDFWNTLTRICLYLPNDVHALQLLESLILQYLLLLYSLLFTLKCALVCALTFYVISHSEVCYLCQIFHLHFGQVTLEIHLPEFLSTSTNVSMHFMGKYLLCANIYFPNSEIHLSVCFT